jgi:YidC/Oxa1 family membrane protein insertase
VIRLAILPLTFKQVRSMQQMQRFQPEMKRLQERYKEDKQRMQQELMKLYQEHGFNPLSSCFPLLLQLPFFFGLYQTLRPHSHVAKEIHASADKHFLFIPDLAAKATGGVLVALLIIYLATQLTSSYVSSVNVQDPTQRRLLFLFPIVFSFIVINFPTGLLLYWITTNIWTVGQQLFIKRFFPAPEPLPATGGAAGKVAPAPAATGAPRKGLWARMMSAAEQSQTAKADGNPGDATKAKPDRRPAKATEKASAEKSAAKPSKPARADGANGGPAKPPPGSPRKKKKRSGRRR